MKKKFFGANWKMNHSLKESKEFFDIFQSSYDINDSQHDIVIFPSMHLLAIINQYTSRLFNNPSYDPIIDLSKPYEIKNSFIGAQNFYCQKNGAFTGEVSADMLLNDGIHHVIIGHSERRQVFHEDDNLIREKLTWALERKINVVLCCGETLGIRENNQTKEFITKQLEHALKGVDSLMSSHLVIAYEPIWAIGTGKVASLEQIEEMHQFINKKIEELGLDTKTIRIIYGGSVNHQNAKEILATPYVDGNLIGSASLDAHNFISILES